DHQVQARRHRGRAGQAGGAAAAAGRCRGGAGVRTRGPGARGAGTGVRPGRGKRLTRPMTDPTSPFDDSRRLTGASLYFAAPGAALETGIGAPVPPALLEGWKERVGRARAAL